LLGCTKPGSKLGISTPSIREHDKADLKRERALSFGFEDTKRSPFACFGAPNRDANWTSPLQPFELASVHSYTHCGLCGLISSPGGPKDHTTWERRINAQNNSETSSQSDGKSILLPLVTSRRHRGGCAILIQQHWFCSVNHTNPSISRASLAPRRFGSHLQGFDVLVKDHYRC
jgi:hypothetical protein